MSVRNVTHFGSWEAQELQLQTKMLMNCLTFELGCVTLFSDFMFWDELSLGASIRLGAQCFINTFSGSEILRFIIRQKRC